MGQDCLRALFNSKQCATGRSAPSNFFTIYIDDLLHQLEQSGVGCYWGHQFVGAVCYADDLALLAPSLSALRLMLNTYLFAETHSLFFNAKKTQVTNNRRNCNYTCYNTSFKGHRSSKSGAAQAAPLLTALKCLCRTPLLSKCWAIFQPMVQ